LGLEQRESGKFMVGVGQKAGKISFPRQLTLA